jgi:hypothetical protein
MEKFYFNRHLNGELIEDRKGLRFVNEEAACRYAVRRAAAFIGRVKDIADTHLGIEVDDGSRTRCIIKASITLEKL